MKSVHVSNMKIFACFNMTNGKPKSMGCHFQNMVADKDWDTPPTIKVSRSHLPLTCSKIVSVIPVRSVYQQLTSIAMSAIIISIIYKHVTIGPEFLVPSQVVDTPNLDDIVAADAWGREVFWGWLGCREWMYISFTKISGSLQITE